MREAATFAAGILLGAVPWIIGRLKPTPPPPPGRKPDIEDQILQAVYEKKLETTAGALDRTQTAAKFVEAAATTVAALYTGALGFVFAADGTPLPWRGFVPTAFLAFAVGLSAVYLAFITRGRLVRPPTFVEADDAIDRLQLMSQHYAEWISSAVRARQAFLRAAVVSLMVGVALLPMPFIEIPAEAATAADEEVAFPTPQFERPVDLAAIVYQAQIDEFVSAQKPAPDSDEAENRIAFYAIIGGAALVLVTLLWTWWVDTDPRGRKV